MDTSRKVNANAGKGSRYTPDAVSQNFGKPNLVSPGQGASMESRIRSQPHSGGAGGQQQPTDMSHGPRPVAAPGQSVGNTGPHPAGVAGPSNSVAGEANIPPPGDLVPGRRGSPAKGGSSERYRGK